MVKTDTHTHYQIDRATFEGVIQFLQDMPYRYAHPILNALGPNTKPVTVEADAPSDDSAC
jgi:hypothetical protein